MKYLEVFRYRNLLMIALTQCIVHYGFLRLHGLPLALPHLQFALLVLATLLIAAGGYLMNDIMDRGTDRINRPGSVLVGGSIPEGQAYNIYAALNIAAVGIGYYLADYIGRSSFVGIFIIISFVLYIYATNFKQTLLIGNVIIAILTSLTVLVVGIFDLVPLILPDNQALMATAFEVLLDYAAFCFIVSLVREIVKDMEDVEGDGAMGMRTLPILFGLRAARLTALVIALVLLVLLLLYINFYFAVAGLYVAAAFSLFFVAGPLLYFIARIMNAKEKQDFARLSAILKVVMLTGILSLLSASLNMLSNG
jgi:4-hydroxybenzoate polyprenyltransferase